MINVLIHIYLDNLHLQVQDKPRGHLTIWHLLDLKYKSHKHPWFHKDHFLNEKGIEIKNIDKVSDDIVVFHAGTALKDGKLVTNGGRVLNVCARGANLQEALAKVYETATIITFDGMYYRHDIGLR